MPWNCDPAQPDDSLASCKPLANETELQSVQVHLTASRPIRCQGAALMLQALPSTRHRALTMTNISDFGLQPVERWKPSGRRTIISSPADRGTHVFEHIPSAGASEQGLKIVGRKVELEMKPFHQNLSLCLPWSMVGRGLHTSPASQICTERRMHVKVAPGGLP